MYINGEKMGADLEKMDVVNPANSEVIGTIPNGGKEEAEQAVDAAYDAFLTWSETTAYERAGFLKKLNNLILENKEELAKTMTVEMGKPLAESKGEVVY